MIGRADIEGSKSNVAMNAWLPQASSRVPGLQHSTAFPPQRASNGPPATRRPRCCCLCSKTSGLCPGYDCGTSSRTGVARTLGSALAPSLSLSLSLEREGREGGRGGTTHTFACVESDSMQPRRTEAASHLDCGSTLPAGLLPVLAKSTMTARVLPSCPGTSRLTGCPRIQVCRRNHRSGTVKSIGGSHG